MSRIFEALQRAELERKIAPVSEDDQFAEPGFFPRIEPLSEPRSALVFENIARYPWRPSLASLPTLADRGAGVEQFRSLRSRVYQARLEVPVKTILISSGLPSEGKSFIAANLAVSLARNRENHILLIDGDLRRPTLHSLLGAPSVPGLSEYLTGDAELQDIMQRAGIRKDSSSAGTGSISNLTFIPSGKCADGSSELVADRRVEELIAKVAPHFDWILIDSPPVLAVTDAVELSNSADAVLLVARGATTTYDAAQRTQAAFNGSRILGFVLNDVKKAPRGGYNYYDYYAGAQGAS